MVESEMGTSIQHWSAVSETSKGDVYSHWFSAEGALVSRASNRTHIYQRIIARF